jgi:hypothetical protein
MRTTWQPYERHGRVTKQSDLPDTVFAFPRQRKEPLTDARHVRNAVARFDQVIDVPPADRALAFANIEKAAKHYGVDLSESSWQELGLRPQSHPNQHARKGTETRKRRARNGGDDMAARKKSSTRKKSSNTRKTSSNSRKKSPGSRKKSGRKYGKKAGKNVERAMHEMKHGELTSGRSGKKVTSRKQAVAIGLSEARKVGAKEPRRKKSS